MRQLALDTFHTSLKEYDLSSLDVADFGGQSKIVMIDGKKRSGVTNPLTEFKSYCSFNICHKPDKCFDLTIPLPPDEEDGYDLVLSFDTLEHIKYPLSFCKNMVVAAKPGGLLYLSTVFAWPYHGSKDYFRFSPEALKVCFEDLPVTVVRCDWDGDSRYLKNQTGVFYFGKKHE